MRQFERLQTTNGLLNSHDMKQKLISISALAATLLSSYAHADVLELKGGQVLNGVYSGGTAATVRFTTPQGVEVVETSKIVALTFTGGGSGAGAAPAAAPAGGAAAPAAAAGSVSVPAGTKLLIRMVDGTSSKDPKGKRFTATLDSDLVVGNQTVAKAGTKVYGRVENAQNAGRYAGKSSLDLRLTDISVGSTLVPILTGPYAQAGSSSMRKTARGAAAGAAIGAIADGGSGAGKGAAIGAVASGLKKGESVVVSPGTLLEFQIQQAVSITPVL
jgi:hypothetical protein